MGSGITLPAGTIFASDYRVVRPLAAGGMGTVYVAEQLSTGKQRALKLMHAELAWDARLRERFVQEARVGASIDSEHVVEVVGAGIDPASGTPWLAMELLDGMDLGTLVQHRGPLPVGEVREIMSQLCHALAAAHRAGIVHRDLKPQNVFVARARQQNVSFKVKVLDFGIAKVVAAARSTSAATSVVGTPLWMAPEQTDPNGFISPASDVWGLGLMAFRLLTARWYWAQAAGEASSVMMLMREVLFEPMVPASARAAQMGVGHLIPPGFDGWFARCLERDHRLRYRDAGEAMQALDSLLFGGYAAPPPARELIPQSAMPMVMPPGALGTTGTGANAHTPASTIEAFQRTQAPASPPPKRGIPAWVWMLLGVSMVLLLAGGTVLVLALAAVGMDASRVPNAEQLEGSYSIADGTNPGVAGRYHGRVTVLRTHDTHQVHWEMATGHNYDGLGIVSENLFGFGHAEKGNYAVAIYEIDGGTLRGKYARSDAVGRVGFEELVGPMGLSGTYRLTRSADGLAGDVHIKPNGSTFNLLRTVSAGGHQGTGIRKDNRLVVTWLQSSSPEGTVGYYEVRPGVLDGKWTFLGNPSLGTETLKFEAGWE